MLTNILNAEIDGRMDGLGSGYLLEEDGSFADQIVKRRGKCDDDG